MRRLASTLGWAAIASIACALLVACSQPKSFSSQHFSFPESIKPHEAGWQYVGVVLMPDVEDPRTQSRRIQVRVADQAKAELLRDDFEVQGVVRPRAVVIWPEHATFTVSIRDASQPTADGSFKRVRDVTYAYDATRRAYRRVR